MTSGDRLPRISLVWCMAENGVIGIENRLPWHLPADLKHFKNLTSGHSIIMGRKTFESFPHPLPNRRHIVVTRDTDYRVPEGCEVVHSIDAALACTAGEDEVFVIGGASLYAQTLARADRLYVTLLHARFEGDARFPWFDWQAWRETAREDHAPDEKNPYPYSFLVLAPRGA